MAKARAISGLFALLLSAAFLSPAPRQTPSPPSFWPPAYVEGEILVKFRPSSSPAVNLDVVKGLGARPSGRLPRRDVFRLKLRPGQTVEEAVRFFRACPEVLFAEPNPTLRLASVEPNDPFFVFQWGLHNIGQSIGPLEGGYPRGRPGADIKAAEAWKVDSGGDVVVAVIDTGVQLHHPDLWRKIWAWGPDYIELDDEPDDAHGHGTLVAGVIGAETDNGLGISGICWNARLLPIRAFNEDAKSDVFTVSEAILWAADNGARVINMSFGGPDIENNLTLRSAVEYARLEKDIVLVGAAGNEGLGDVWYPSAYRDVVLSVAATDYNDIYQTLSTTGGEWGSNYGPEVDLAAPGVLILSTWPLDRPLRSRPGWEGYAYGAKTSMSTAFVSGAAALLRSHRPELKAGQVETILFQAADDINASPYAGWDPYLGWGRVNLQKALHLLDPLQPPLNARGYRASATGLRPRGWVVLTWEDNPANGLRSLAKYRVYVRDGAERRLLAEVDPSVHFYIELGAAVGKTKAYEIVPLDEILLEGRPAAVVVSPTN